MEDKLSEKINKLSEKIENPYKRPPKDTVRNQMTNFWADQHCHFVPYTEIPKEKRRKNELGRMYGCSIIYLSP